MYDKGQLLMRKKNVFINFLSVKNDLIRFMNKQIHMNDLKYELKSNIMNVGFEKWRKST